MLREQLRDTSEEKHKHEVLAKLERLGLIVDDPARRQRPKWLSFKKFKPSVRGGLKRRLLGYREDKKTGRLHRSH